MVGLPNLCPETRWLMNPAEQLATNKEINISWGVLKFKRYRLESEVPNRWHNARYTSGGGQREENSWNSQLLSDNNRSTNGCKASSAIRRLFFVYWEDCIIILKTEYESCHCIQKVQHFSQALLGINRA